MVGKVGMKNKQEGCRQVINRSIGEGGMVWVISIPIELTPQQVDHNSCWGWAICQAFAQKPQPMPVMSVG